jgi:glycosyltransferase involved in cell wall biosynthesis
MVLEEALSFGGGLLVGGLVAMATVRPVAEHPNPHRHPYTLSERSRGEFRFTYYRVGAGSFKVVADHYISALTRKGYEVEVRDHHDHLRFFKYAPEQKNDIAIVHPLFHAKRQALNYLEKCHKHIFCFEVADTTMIGREYVEFANDDRIDGIFLPSTFSVEAFRRSGVMNHTFLVPHGVCEKYSEGGFDIRNPTLQAIANDTRTKILVFCLHSSFRKGWDVALQALKRLKARYKFVAVVKTYPMLDLGVRRDLHDARIDHYVINDWLSEEEMISLYDLCDVLLYPYRSGAFELPVLEALARGLPVVVTGWGCVLDYVSFHEAYLITPTRLIKIFPMNTWGHIGMGADPDVEHTIQLMTFVLDNLEYCRKKARRQISRYLAQTWDSCVDTMLRAVKEVWESA